MRGRRTIVRIMKTPRKQVIDWLFPRARKNVLTLMLMDPRGRWHLRDVVRRTGCAIGTVRRELAGLYSLAEEEIAILPACSTASSPPSGRQVLRERDN